MALSWWTALSPRERGRYRRQVHGGDDALLPRHALNLAMSGLEPGGWRTVGSSTADNDRAHRFDVVLGGGRGYPMPNPVRRLVLTDLARSPLTNAGVDAPPRWWQRLASPHR